MSIVQQEDELKGVPDDRLVSEMQNPTGMFPPYLVFTEINRREELRGRFAEEQSQMPTTSMAEEAVAQMMNGGLPMEQPMEQGLGQGMPQDMQGMQGMPPGMDQGMPPGMPPGMDQGMPPMSPGMDQGIASGPPMQMMSNGGMVRGFANGSDGAVMNLGTPITNTVRGSGALGLGQMVRPGSAEEEDVFKRLKMIQDAQDAGLFKPEMAEQRQELQSLIAPGTQPRKEEGFYSSGAQFLNLGPTLGRLLDSSKGSAEEGRRKQRDLQRELGLDVEEPLSPNPKEVVIPLGVSTAPTSTLDAKSVIKGTGQPSTTTGTSGPVVSDADRLRALKYVSSDTNYPEQAPFEAGPAFVPGPAPSLEPANKDFASGMEDLKNLFDTSVMTDEQLEENLSKRMDKYRESNTGPDKNSMLAQSLMQIGSGLLGKATFSEGLSQGFSDMAKTTGAYNQDVNAYNKDMGVAEQAIYETSLARQQKMSDRQFQGRSALVDMSQRINQGAMDRNARMQSDYLSSENANRRAAEANESANRRAYDLTLANDQRAARNVSSQEQIAENQFNLSKQRSLLAAATRSGDVRMREDYDRLESIREALIDPLKNMDPEEKKELKRQFAIISRRLAGEDRLNRGSVTGRAE